MGDVMAPSADFQAPRQPSAPQQNAAPQAGQQPNVVSNGASAVEGANMAEGAKSATRQAVEEAAKASAKVSERTRKPALPALPLLFSTLHLILVWFNGELVRIC